MARSAGETHSFLELLQGYFISYRYTLILILLGFLITIIIPLTRQKLWINLKSTYKIAFVIFFPTIENIIMREHAITYSFDRLKFILPLIFIFLLIYEIWEKEIKSTNLFKITISSVISLICILNLLIYSYTNNYYRWKVDYLSDNEKFVNEIIKLYNTDNSIIVKNGWRAWGFTQMLFKRNVYCTALYPTTKLKEILKEQSKQYIVLLYPQESNWDKERYTEILVYDDQKKDVNNYIYDSNMGIQHKNISKEVKATDLTDPNWTKGISNYEAAILFENTIYNNALLSTAEYITSNGHSWKIQSIEISDFWITLRFNEQINEQELQYPNNIIVS